MAHKWADLLPHHITPAVWGVTKGFRAGDKIRRGPQADGLATSPLPHGGSPTLQSGGQNQKWPTSGRIGYLTYATWGVLNVAHRGIKSELGHT